MVLDVILGQLAFALAGVYSIAGDGSQLLTAVVLIVHVVSYVLQVLHVGPEKEEKFGLSVRSCNFLNILHIPYTQVHFAATCQVVAGDSKEHAVHF